MIQSLTIANFKSILRETIELSNVNVFIGENGCGKTNILEAVAMLGAAKESSFVIQNLANRGARITKPALTMSSFKGQKAKNELFLSAKSVDALEIMEIPKRNKLFLNPMPKIKSLNYPNCGCVVIWAVYLTLFS